MGQSEIDCPIQNVWDNQIVSTVLQVLESLSFDEVEIWFTVSLGRLSHTLCGTTHLRSAALLCCLTGLLCYLVLVGSRA
jgi:hypothetical protein